MRASLVSSADKAFSSRVLSLCFEALGLILLAWAFLSPDFRDADGFPEGTICLPIAAGLAAVVLGVTATGPWRRAGFWLAASMVGQAVALQLIEAGKEVRYQHYLPFRLLVDTHPLLLAWLVAQTAVVAAGINARGQAIRTCLMIGFGGWRLAAVGLVLLLFPAALSREIPVYLAELPFAAFLQLLNLGTIVLLAWSLPRGALASLKRRLGRILEPQARQQIGKRGAVDRLVLMAAVWVTVLAALLSLLIYERHPHLQDEVMYLYQARYLAEGRLTVPAAPVPEAFSIYMVPYRADQWYSPFPPGWPAMLSLGVRIGVPWLINPILAGLNVLLAFVLIREMYNLRTAHLSVLLLSTSPWYLFMAMNFMSHTFTLTCALTATFSAIRARQTGKAAWGWVAGCAAGMVSLIRPMDGVIVAGLLGFWAVGIGGRRWRVFPFAAFVLGGIAVGGLVLPYNSVLTGNPLVQPLDAYYEQYFGHNSNALGFGPERGLGWPLDPFPGHSPLEALINADLNLFSINVELFGWSTGSLLPIAVLLFSRSMARSDCPMLAVVAANLGAYSLYWFNGGPDFGARYWYLMLVPLVALAVRGGQSLAHMLSRLSNGSTQSGVRVKVAVLTLCLLATVNYLPWRALDKYHRYLGMRPDITLLAEEYGFGKSLVLIRGGELPDYASAWAYNPLDLQADAPVYAWDRDPETRSKLLKAYGDRPVWVVAGPSLTHRGYEVTVGPMLGSQLLADR